MLSNVSGFPTLWCCCRVWGVLTSSKILSPYSGCSNVSRVEETVIVPLVSHISMGVEPISFLGPVPSLFLLGMLLSLLSNHCP